MNKFEWNEGCLISQSLIMIFKSLILSAKSMDKMVIALAFSCSAYFLNFLRVFNQFAYFEPIGLFGSAP